MVHCIASNIAAQIIALMISGEMPIDPKVIRGCCGKLAAAPDAKQPAPALSRLVEAVEVLDTAILFKLPERDLARMREKAREALLACSAVVVKAQQAQAGEQEAAASLPDALQRNGNMFR